MHSQDQKGRVLQISRSVEKVRVKSKSGEKNPESKIKVANEKVSHKGHCGDDWKNDPTNSFSPLFDNRSNDKISSSNNCKEVNNNNDWRKDATNYFNENCTTI
ncbi:MAG: hypothetical protein PV340_01285 [Wolbachia sp.]|nr:hypothetical protein [Wolbachia sp.]MDD9335858.1 hypothetical protein [Wolbachia sp.]